jgi:hypothetical protein
MRHLDQNIQVNIAPIEAVDVVGQGMEPELYPEN